MSDPSPAISEIAYVRLVETLLKASEVIKGPLGARSPRERADGSFRIVVANRDPKMPNWLDTTGIDSGNLIMRAIECEEENLDVTFERVSL
jgi:hypothetical protein